MYIKPVLLLTTVIFLLEGCDPSYSIILSNKSASAKNITVKYPKNVTHTLGDTLYAGYYYEGNKNINSPIIISSKDTSSGTYNFVLPNDDEVTIGIMDMSHSGYPLFGQMVIINNADTVLLNRKNKNLVKKHSILFGGEWRYTIR